MAEEKPSADGAPKPSSVESAPAKADAPVDQGAIVATPEEHALATGNGPVVSYGGSLEAAPTKLTFNGKEERARLSVAHEMAAILHGWWEHAHHADAPIQLSRADYLKALKAAETPWHADTCPKRGHVLGDSNLRRNELIRKLHGSPIPHEPALSQYAEQAHVNVLKLAKELGVVQ